MSHTRHLGARVRLSDSLVLAAAAALLLAAGCATSPGKITVQSPADESGTSVDRVDADYPPDGWYAAMFLEGRRPDRRTELSSANQLRSLAQANGYPNARVFVYPGSPSRCQGMPCTGTGPAPGDFLIVVLDPDAPIPGPDPTVRQKDPGELTKFIDQIVLQRQELNAKAATTDLSERGLNTLGLNALADPSKEGSLYPVEMDITIKWLGFSALKDYTWELNPETSHRST